MYSGNNRKVDPEFRGGGDCPQKLKRKLSSPFISSLLRKNK